VLNRAVATTAAPWSSIAWLGWAGVGMTRGSEYAALARERGLRPLLREEGKALFAEFLDRPAAARNRVQVSEGELRFYDVALRSPPAAGRVNGSSATDVTWQLSTAAFPFLRDHRANGVPTVPGTFELELAVRTARNLRPSRCVVSVEQAVFDRFVRVHDNSITSLRARTRIIEDDACSTLVEVGLHSDFVHKSGRVLQQDIRHFSACVRLADEPYALQTKRAYGNGEDGVAIIDPYLAADSPVKLAGLFRCLDAVRLHSDHCTAAFRFAEPSGLAQIVSFQTPFLLLDAMTRCSVLHVEGDRTMRVWVPISARRTFLPQNLNDASLHAAGTVVRIHSAAPRFERDLVFSDHVQALDAEGRVLIVVEGLVARHAGQVHLA
jgi:hypothetical protein